MNISRTLIAAALTSSATLASAPAAAQGAAVSVFPPPPPLVSPAAGTIDLHALAEVPGLTLEQVKEVTGMGALIEYVFLNDLMGPQAHMAWMRHWRRVSVADLAKVVKEVGADHIIASSDLGQLGNPVHADGMETIARGLLAAGISQADVDKMTKRNPARFLGAK